MAIIDYVVLVGFMIWMLVIGGIFSTRIKNSSDMFIAGGSSPWWISGLSGFMTIFSAGTFVVWGGIAYRLGLVAVSILMVTGMSTILVGATVAARWRRMGITTPTEFLRIRFNEPIVQTYTWIGMVYRGIGLGVGLYSLAVMLAILVPLPDGAPFRDAQTGNLSVNWSIVLWGAVVIAYTMAGGLWAVLMTDVIQCLILCLVVIVAVPLSISAIGGIDQFWIKAPADFLSPAAAEYTYNFLFLWFWLGFFRYASDWGFVQRYLCVPTPRDARKVAYLMGGLYLFSPIIWMLPAMAYRIINPEADPKEAYVLMCCKVLPAGMLGIMVAAMFSATASMVSSLLNVFAGVFTCDVYKPFINPNASEARMVLVGRLATLVYGILVVGLAILVPYCGGAEELVLVLVTSLLGPLSMPIVWGLYSRHIDHKSVWITLGVCAVATVILKFGPSLSHWLVPSTASVLDEMSATPLAIVISWLKDNPRLVDAILGLLLPLAVLTVIELASRRKHKQSRPGWNRLEAALASYSERSVPMVASRLPTQIIAASMGMLGVTMSIITIFASSQRLTLATFSIMLLLVTAVMAYFAFRSGGGGERPAESSPESEE